MVLARQRRFEVGLHARLGRAPAEQAEGIAGELRLGEERRQAADNRMATAQGENPASSTEKLAMEIALCNSPEVRMTSDSGRLDASRRARVSLS